MRKLIILALLCLPLAAQTAINDTLYLQGSTPWTGQITVSWPAFTSCAGVPIARGSRTVAVNAGVVAISLWPSDCAAPSFAYSATYRTMGGANHGQTWTETWVVPSVPSIVTLATVRATSTLTMPWTSVSGKPVTFAPSAHASTHASGATDPITPAAIGAEPVDAKIVRKDASGNVSISSTVPPGAPAGSLAAAGQVYSAQPFRVNGSKSLYAGQRFGVAFHFGLPTWHGTEDGTVTGAASLFAPTGLDIDQWLDTAMSVGAKYVILGTKWYDGFDLWPTKMFVPGNPAYSIAATSWYAANGSPDIVGLFVQKARARNLNVGLYMNFHDSKWQALTGKTPASDTTAYTNWIEGQLQELLTWYGPIDAIWVDGWSWTGYTANLSYATVSAFVKGLQPNCLLINNQRTHPATASDVETYEIPGEGFPFLGNTRPSDVFATLAAPANKWFYDATCNNLTPAKVSSLWNPTVYGNYTLTLNLGPGTDGRIPACQVTALQSGIAAALAAIPAYALNPTPLSYGKTATASTVYNVNYPASKVTDGNYAPTVQTETWISNDATDQNPEIEIDLGSVQAINTVQIWNGPAPSAGRLRDLTVTVCTATPCAGGNALYTSPTLNPLNVLGGGNADYLSGPAVIVATGINTAGRYVRVTRTGIGGSSGNYTSLAIAEIAVF